MTRYAIVAFPETDALATIEGLRRRFDPIATLIPAHVTLVFPFETPVLLADLRSHVEHVVSSTDAFDVQLSRVSREDDGYLFLNIDGGRDHVVGLHDRLYTGLLAEHLSGGHVYRPHITLGRIVDRDALNAAAVEAAALLPESAHGIVREVAVFRLDGPHHGEVVFTIGLGGRPE